MNTDVKELLLSASPALLSEYKNIAEYKLKENKTSLFRTMIESTSNSSYSPSYRRVLELNIKLLEEILSYIGTLERDRQR